MQVKLVKDSPYHKHNARWVPTKVGSRHRNSRVHGRTPAAEAGTRRFARQEMILIDRGAGTVASINMLSKTDTCLPRKSLAERSVEKGERRGEKKKRERERATAVCKELR